MLRRAACPLIALTLLAGCGGTGGGEQAVRTQTISIETGGASVEAKASSAGDVPEVPGDDRCDGSTQTVRELGVRQAEIVTRCLLNAAREQQGLAPLEFSETLARAAATRSESLAEANVFTHRGPDGQTVESVVRGTGWIPESRSWLLGENIGWGEHPATTPAHLVHGWLNSPQHRQNIMSERFTQIGVGIAPDAPREGVQGATFTTVFGARGEAARG